MLSPSCEIKVGKRIGGTRYMVRFQDLAVTNMNITVFRDVEWG
jgi:hypothetical protein